MRWRGQDSRTSRKNCPGFGPRAREAPHDFSGRTRPGSQGGGRGGFSLSVFSRCGGAGTLKAVPSSGAPVKRTAPPWLKTAPWTKESPGPVPCPVLFVVDSGHRSRYHPEEKQHEQKLDHQADEADRDRAERALVVQGLADGDHHGGKHPYR